MYVVCMEWMLHNKQKVKQRLRKVLVSACVFLNLALQLPETARSAVENDAPFHTLTHTQAHTNFSPVIKGQCAIQTHQVALKQKQLSRVHQYGHKCPL